MRIKLLLFLLVCFLLSGLAMPAIACPPPDCGSCCHWVSTGPGPSDGYCDLNTGVECGDCHGCYNPCYSCVSCFCEWDCSPGATCCNGSCCNSGNCCNGTTCCSNSDDVCCTDSGTYCCESDESCCKGICCEPNYTCCDGTCCNASTQKCCDDIGGINDGYCCDTNDICCKGNCCDPNLCLDCNSTTGQCESICDPNTEFCCDGTCCKNWQCCIDGNCVDPICEDCSEVNDVVYECYHEENEPNCATNKCLMNVLSTASCEWKGYDWPCNKMHCDADEDFWEDPQVVQYEIEDPNVTCPGGNQYLSIEPWYELWWGCTLCIPEWGDVACVTTASNCPGTPTDPVKVGIKKVCGKCY